MRSPSAADNRTALNKANVKADADYYGSGTASTGGASGDWVPEGAGGSDAFTRDRMARAAASRAQLLADLSVPGGSSGGGGLANVGGELVRLNAATLHAGGDSWDNVQPLWNDQAGNAVMPQAGVPITGNLREIRGPAVPYPYPEQLPSGGAATPLVDDAGHLYYRVSAPGMEKVVSAPSMAASSGEVQRIEIVGKRPGLGESYVSALGEMATSAVEGVQNLGGDAWDRSLANVASMMGIRGNEAGPARSGFFQRVDRIGWPGAVVVTGLQASALGPYESLGAAGSAGVDTLYGLATGNNNMAARGGAQLTVMAAGMAVGPMTSRVGGLVFGDAAALNAGANLSISTSAADLRAIAAGVADLNSRQATVLAQLDGFGSRAVISKGGFGQTDLAALSAATGDEFAMFTTGGRRLIVRGDSTGIPIGIADGSAQALADQGWRWSAHVHPDGSLMSSIGDRNVLSVFSNTRSAVLDPFGGRGLFNPNGDMISSSWLP